MKSEKIRQQKKKGNYQNLKVKDRNYYRLNQEFRLTNPRYALYHPELPNKVKAGGSVFSLVYRYSQYSESRLM